MYVKVIAGAGVDRVEKISDGEFIVRTTAQPERGKANARVVELLADFFHVAKSRVTIVGGKTTRKKIVDILE